MTFTPNIPASGQTLGNTRDSIRNNFTVLKNANDVNHVAINTTGAGKHKFLQMPEQGSAPSTSTNEGGFYTKDSGGYTNLFWKQESGGADPNKNQGAEIQLTGLKPIASTSGRTFLPSGLTIYFGSASVGVGTSGTVSFPNGDFPNNIFCFMATPIGSSINTAGFAVTSYNTSGFSYSKVTTLTTINYIAIGN